MPTRDRFEWVDSRVETARPASDGRPRFLAVGFLDGQLVSLVFALVGSEAFSIIKPAAGEPQREESL